MAKCKGCGATIIWINTPADRHIPCDEGIIPYWKDSKGDQKIVTQDGEVVTCWLDGDPSQITGCGRIPHWATCPNGEFIQKEKREVKVEPEKQKKTVLYFIGGDGISVPLGEIRSIEMTESVNEFGEPYSLGIDLISNAFAQAELLAYFTAEEFRKLFKVFGIKRKILADRRRMESARRYRERKRTKRRKGKQNDITKATQ